MQSTDTAPATINLLDPYEGGFRGCPNCGRLPRKRVHPITRKFLKWEYRKCFDRTGETMVCEPVQPVGGAELKIIQYKFWRSWKAGDVSSKQVLGLINEVNALRTRIAETASTEPSKQQIKAVS